MNNICKCPFPYCDDISSIHFINPNQISFNCFRNHIITKEINQIQNGDNINIYDLCQIHKIKFYYFCNTCKINFCSKCKENHMGHKYISIIEKIPSKYIFDNLVEFINKEKNELKNIKILFYELLENIKEEFDKIYNIFNRYLLCEESVLKFSINNINHFNSIENIKYIFDINFDEYKYNEKIISNLNKIKFNFEELKSSIKAKSIFEKIENVYKYIENIYLSSNEKRDKDKLFEQSFNINYTNIFKNKKKNKNRINLKEYDEMNDKIKKVKFELNQYKILNEHEAEIRNIISLNNGFFISSSLDGTFKLFNSLTGECFLSMSEPYGDQISQIIKLNSNKEINKLDTTYLLLFSRHLIFIRLNNNIFYNHEYKDINELENENNFAEIIQSIDNNGIYISQGIQLTNSDIVAFNDNNEIKIYKLNPQTQTYLLHNYNINNKLIEFSSLLEIKPNIFVASSNEHLDNGKNILKFFDLNNNTNNNNEIVINNINCSTGRDSLCMIQKNKFLAVGLQYFNDINNKNDKKFVNGIAIVDVNYYQVVQIIEDIRVHSLCKINLYVDYFLLIKDDILKKELCFTKRKILAVAGYDQENEKRLIKFYEIIMENNNNCEYKFVNIIKRNEIISEHEGFINSIKWLKNGLLVTCSSDKMIFLYKHINLDI